MENSKTQIISLLKNSIAKPRVNQKQIVTEYYDIPAKLTKKQLKTFGFNKQKDMYNFYINLFIEENGITPKEFVRKEKEIIRIKKIRKEAFKRERNKRVNNYKSKIVEDHIHGFKNTKYITNTKNQQELYENAKKRMGEDGYYGQLVLYFVRNNDNKAKKTTIAPSYLDTYEEFKNRLDEIKQGQVEGSDAIPDNEYNFIENVYNIVNTDIKGGSSSKFMIFNTRNMDSKDGLCWKYCLDEMLNTEFDGINDNKYSNLIEFCSLLDEYNNKHKNNKIAVIGNSFSYKTNFMDMKKNKEIISFDCGKKSLKGIKPTLNDINLVYLNSIKNLDNCSKIIIYDEINRHYDIIDELNIDENILISYCNKVFKNTDKGYKMLFSPSQINKTNKKNDFVNNYKVFFDYETVINFNKSNCMEEYSCSILICSDKDLDELDDIDINGNKEILNKFLYPEYRPDRVICFKGYDCSTQLINWILKNQITYLGKDNNRFDFISFNGSNFDNFILLNALLKQDETDIITPQLNISDVFYNGNQILNFKINMKHSTFDIKKHLAGSLADCCKGFKIKLCSKLDFNHNKAQKLHDKGKLIEFITDNKELEEYNNFDCISLAIIFKRYKDALLSIPETKQYGENLTDNKTIGGVIYNIFKNHTKDLYMDYDKTEKLKFEKLKLEHYKDILKYKCAGRVEMFNGIQEILENMMSLDICSMYPYVMGVLKDAYYPCGNIEEVDKFDSKKMGFYYCDIDQSNLKEKNLPNIYPKKDYAVKANGDIGELIGNDWDSDEILENYMISSIMIKQLLRYGCKVVIKSGITFQYKMRGCDLFEFILEFMKKKNEQDINKKEKPELYNSALRETYKLLMNSLSGKVIEGLHLDKTEMTTSYEFQQLVSRMSDDDDEDDDNEDIKKSCFEKSQKANCKNEASRKIYYYKLLENALSKSKKQKKKKPIESITAINFIGNKVFTSYKINEEDEINKQRPIYLGVCVYDYSKCYIYDTLYAVIGKKDLVYTDTDAGKFRSKKFKEVKDYYSKNYVPYWDKVLKYDKRYKGHKLYEPNSKVFGSYENEMDELPNNDRFYCFQKKSWVCIDTKAYIAKKENSFKMSFKGVPKNAIIIDNPETTKYNWLKLTYNKKGTQKQIKKDYEVEIINDKECLEFYQTGKTIKDNLIYFCDELYNKKYIYVLTQNFKRVVKNTSRNITDLNNTEKLNIMNNTIQVQPIIKKIRI